MREAPRGPNWLHEIKHDGYRTICVVDEGAVSIYTRRGHNWADRMPSIARALSALKVRSAVIDGEAIVIGEDGLSDFFTLHAALARRNAPRAMLGPSISYTSTVRTCAGASLRTAVPFSRMW